MEIFEGLWILFCPNQGIPSGHKLYIKLVEITISLMNDLTATEVTSQGWAVLELNAACPERSSQGSALIRVIRAVRVARAGQSG